MKWIAGGIAACVVLVAAGFFIFGSFERDEPLSDSGSCILWSRTENPFEVKERRALKGFDCLDEDLLCPEAESRRMEEEARFRELKARAEEKAAKSRKIQKLLACDRKVSRTDQVVVFPFEPVSGERMRFVAVTRNRNKSHSFWIIDDEGNRLEPDEKTSWGHYPKAYGLTFSSLPPGRYVAAFSNRKSENSEVHACKGITVKQAPARGERTRSVVETGAWEIRNEWSPQMEDLFSVFVNRLFKIQRGGHNSWRPLHQPLKDPHRNLFYNALGWNEDYGTGAGSVRIFADCADAPYALRAYFAWKMGLPFLFNRCTRGGSRTGPVCKHKRDNLTTLFDYIDDPVERFNRFVWRHVNWAVHTGNGRTLPDDDDSDMYPVELTEDALRPGLVFVDAAGHFILVTERYLQTDKDIGALYGVDAHPDFSVSSKRFAEGTFVFNPRVTTDGFKAFRPIVYSDGEIRFMTNDEINKTDGYWRWSGRQAELKTSREFYRKTGSLLNPNPLQPIPVLEANIALLKDLTRQRIEAVKRGLSYMEKRRWALMSMPDGSEIFQTSGPWEAYSTPARDMRYLIALDNVMDLPGTILNNPEIYELPDGVNRRTLKKQFTNTLHELLHSSTFHYKRSDGSEWMLTLWDMIERRERLEIAYNPNDCVEIRWGAEPGTEESETCKRRAPREQRVRMARMRRWFRTRYRPTAEE